MINHELVATSLLQSQPLGMQIKNYYQILDSNDITALQDMKIYIGNMMQAKGKDDIFLSVLAQMNIMIESKLHSNGSIDRLQL